LDHQPGRKIALILWDADLKVNDFWSFMANFLGRRSSWSLRNHPDGAMAGVIYD
jgi:hypothetical protein